MLEFKEDTVLLGKRHIGHIWEVDSGLFLFYSYPTGIMADELRQIADKLDELNNIGESK